MNIKNIVAAVTMVGLLSGAANASTFNFSYTFSSGDVVTGSFSGNTQGNLITDLSNATVALNGIQFPTEFSTISRWSDTSPFWIYDGAVASFDGKQNNFNIFASDSTMVSLFNIVPISYMPAHSYIVYLPWKGPESLIEVYDPVGSYDPARWHVVAVPEPETYAMLMAGMGLIGAIARRRKEQVGI